MPAKNSGWVFYLPFFAVAFLRSALTVLRAVAVIQLKLLLLLGFLRHNTPVFLQTLLKASTLVPPFPQKDFDISSQVFLNVFSL